MPLTIENKTFYSLPEISEKTKLGVRSIRNYIRMGKLKAVKLGVRYWVDSTDLARLISEGTCPPVKYDRKKAVENKRLRKKQGFNR